MVDGESKDLVVLGTIKSGTKTFDKISKVTKIEPKELDQILQSLEKRSLIQVIQKKGLFGTKVEIHITAQGDEELRQGLEELQQTWNQMTKLWKGGDKQKLQQYFDDQKSFLPMMMFFGIIDIVMFSTMLGFMGAVASDYLNPDQIPHDMDGGQEGGSSDGGDGGGGDFDIDVGF